MALLGVSPGVARPTALALNILVASLVLVRFWRRGHVSFRSLVPFLIGSIPFAFVGGAISLPTEVYKPVLGVVLIVAAIQFARTARRVAEEDLETPQVPFVAAVVAGAVIGLLSGLTGTGGGI